MSYYRAKGPPRKGPVKVKVKVKRGPNGAKGYYKRGSGGPPGRNVKMVKKGPKRPGQARPGPPGGDARRDFWLQRAKGKKRVKRKVKRKIPVKKKVLKKVYRPSGPAGGGQTAKRGPPVVRPASEYPQDRRMTVRASPIGVKGLVNQLFGDSKPPPRAVPSGPPGRRPGAPRSPRKFKAKAKVKVKRKVPGSSSNRGAPGGPPKHKPVPQAPSSGDDVAARRRLEQEARAEAARKRQEAARKREEAARKREEAAQKREEARRRREEEERKRREAEARRRREEEERRKREEEARRRREAEERRRQEEEERRAREEEEERLRLEEEERLRLEEEERLRLEEEQAAAAYADDDDGAGGGEYAYDDGSVMLSVGRCDYDGATVDDELSFREGDILLVVAQDDSGWWQGELNGVVGWFPSTFTREASEEERAIYFEEVNASAEMAVDDVLQRPEEVSGPECGHCQIAMSAFEEQSAVELNGVLLHPACMGPFRKAKRSANQKKAPSMPITAPVANSQQRVFGTKPNTMEAFEIQGLLGKGRFGKVYQVVKKDTGRVYAIKALLKEHILGSEAQKVLVEREKSILQRIDGPFLVRCYHQFEDDEKLYFVMECASGGELFVHLSREQVFDVERVRFYAAEIFLGLEYLHGEGIVYRDLKPENVLLTAQGHILMTDFGISKEGLDENADRTATFCGTPEYLAPEVLLGQGYGKAVDWWSFGSVVYEMLTGLPPFYSDDITEMYRKILQSPLEIPKTIDRDAAALLKGLLNRDQEARLQDPQKIRKHPFFRSVDWRKMIRGEVPPPYVPPEEFVYDDDDDDLSKQAQEAFADFDYDEDYDGEDYEEDAAIPDDGQMRCKVLHDWDGEGDDDLSIRVGDIVVILDQSDPDGWWEGFIEAEQLQGFFPSNFVQEV